MYQKIRPYLVPLITAFILIGCTAEEDENIYPQRAKITESVYASGRIKAVDQYQSYTSATGPIQAIFVEEGDTVSVGQPLLAVFSEREKLSRENAEIASAYADLQANQSRLRDLELSINFARSKMLNDSSLYAKQQNLWAQNIGSEIELEQKELAYENSKTTSETALLKYQDLKKEIEFNEKSAQKNLAISRVLESEYVLKSKIDGRVYAILKEKGEMVTPQTPLAVLGSADEFLLELIVDEYDISKVKVGQTLVVTMDSFKGETFEAVITKVFPLMDAATKSFTLEAKFTKEPDPLYPNLSLEANIILSQKENTLIIPRTFLIDDRYVLNSDGDSLAVEPGIKNYESAEILSGISETTELKKPGQ